MVDAARRHRTVFGFPRFEQCKNYVDKFDLLKYIQLKTEVVAVDPIAPFLFKITLQKVDENMKPTGEPTFEAWSKTVLCNTGMENIPRIAKLPGDETAKMPIVHNQDIKKAEDLPEDGEESESKIGDQVCEFLNIA